MRFAFLGGLCLLVVWTSFGGMTLDEFFGGHPRTFGAPESGWSVPAGQLVGDNCGSYFFDLVFDKPLPPLTGMRTIATLRTASRLSIAFASFGDAGLRFSFSDRDRTYGYTFEGPLEVGRTYSFGVTWDGEVVRLYRDGRCVHSGVQPLAVKAKVRDFHLGPFKDAWVGPRTWANDTHVSRVRFWNVARSVQEVAQEANIVFRSLVETHPPCLMVPEKPLAASMPQLVRGNFAGKSGEIPPHAFRLSFDRDNLYLESETLFPGRIPMTEGLARSPGQEPEVFGAESWEAYFGWGDQVYRFGANVAGGTTESRNGVKTWDGEWTHSTKREVKIDDSVFWKTESVFPWKTFGLDGAPDEPGKFNFCRSWTLASFGGYSSLNVLANKYGIRLSVPTLVFDPSTAAFSLQKRTDPASGEYSQESTVAAPGPCETEYRLSLARMDGALEPMAVYSRRRKMARGDVATDSVSVRTDVPGYDALLHELYTDGRVSMREIVPYALSVEPFTATPFFLKEQIRVTPMKPLSGSFRLIRPDGTVAAETDAAKGATAFAFPRTNAPGVWKVVLADGECIVGERRMNYPGVGDWERQDFHADWVLPPFKPLRTTVGDGWSESAFSDRVYRWERSFLPASVTSVGEELLASPAEILIDGKPVVCEAFDTISNRPSRVDFRTMGGGVSSCAWLEYDGVNWNEITVVPANGGSLSVRYVLKGNVAKYLHAATGAGWGSKRTVRVPDGVCTYGAFPTFWIGDEERGLCFFYETRADWTSEPQKTYVVEKADGRVSVTVNVSKGLKPGVPFRFGIGFQATPMRPRSANYPFDTLGWSFTGAMNREGRRPTSDILKLHARDGGDLGSFFGDQDTDDGRKTASSIRRDLDEHATGHSVRPVFYTAARHLSVRYPETEAFLPTWTYRPEAAMDYNRTGHFVYDCCPTTTASDFFAARVRALLKRYPDMRGVYFDFGICHPCNNGEHGCRERLPLLGQREFYRRMAVVQLEAGIADPLVVVHNTDCVLPPAMSFATHLLNGEHVRQDSSSLLHDKKDILDTYGLEMFASELSSLPWGVSNSVYMPYDVLSPKYGGDEPLEPYQFRMTRASMGACLVHNTMQCPWRNHFGIFDKVIRFYDRFGVDKAEFVGYWKSPSKVIKGEGVYVSCYRRDDRVLAVVSHLAHEHRMQDVEIAFDLEKLGVKVPLARAADLMTAADPDYAELFARRTRERISVSRAPLALGDFGTRVNGFDGRVLKYRLPFHSFGLVELVPAEPAPSFDPSTVLPKTSTVTSVRRCAAGEKLGAKAKEVKKPCTVVEWVSSPVPQSKIRCRVILPEKDAWNGMLYGVGGGGRSGYGYPLAEAAKGFAAATSDLGSGAGQASNTAAMVDFAWRSTHVMTVEAKKVVEAFYGRKIVRSVFVGGSTGGGQGIREASEFPEDYDGIVVTSPCINRINQNAGNYWKFLQTHGPDGTPLFDLAKCETLQASTIDWFADKDEPYCRGKFLSDTRYDKRAADGVLDLAAKRDAFFADPDIRARLHQLWEGPVVDGRCLGFGQPMGGRIIGDLLKQDADALVGFCWSWHCGETRKYRDVTWEDFRAFAEECAYLNMRSCDLSRFRDRGGKLIVIAGGTDRTVPQGMAIEWYERMVAETCGGDIEKAKEFARLYVVQLCGHGNGRCGIPVGAGVVLDWIEKDKAPERQMATGTDFDGKRQAFPVAVYPMKMSGSETDGWREVLMGRSLPRVADEWWYPRKCLQEKERMK